MDAFKDGRIQDERMAIERFHENDKMSKYVIHNGTVYMSGQVADDPSQDFELRSPSSRLSNPRPAKS